MSVFLLLLLASSGRSPYNPISDNMVFNHQHLQPLEFDNAFALLQVLKSMDAPVIHSPFRNTSSALGLSGNSGIFSRGSGYHLFSMFDHTNVDLHYAATDCSSNDLKFFLCPVQKLTRDNLDDDRILDFWGEGRILSDNGLITGFTDSYNVNHQKKLVSNGEYKGFNIPNRIPTTDYHNVDTSSLIADSSFRYVTVMGSPVYPASAEEMYRIVRKDNNARIVFYGDEDVIVDNIQIASQDDFVHAEISYQYIESLAPKLLVPTIRPINVMVPIKQLLLDLDAHIENNEPDLANNIIQDLMVYMKKGYSQARKIALELDKKLGIFTEDSHTVSAVEARRFSPRQ